LSILIELFYIIILNLFYFIYTFLLVNNKQFEMLVGTLPFSSKDRRQTMEQILKAKLRMPEFLSQEAQSLLRALFKRNPMNRLGSGTEGCNEIKKHPFFASIDWQKLYNKEIKPPFQPTVHADETYYFDREFTSRTPKDSPGMPLTSGPDLFRGFSFIAPIVLNETTGGGSSSSNSSSSSNANNNSSTNSTNSTNTTLTSSSLSSNSNLKLSQDISQMPPPSMPPPLQLINNKNILTDNNNNNNNNNNASSQAHKENKRVQTILDNLNRISLVKSYRFEDDYQLHEEINSGSFSVCKRCVHKKTQTEFAVKVS
jgi:serine/threonine protein kinase